ncbi:MAG: hypothetical protein ABEH78_02685 [Haloferacaceae archaeon]
MTEYYDHVLALIPLTLIATAGLLVGVGWDVAVAVPVGASPSVLLIGHALFVNGPVDAGPATAESTTGSAGSTGVGPVSAD